MYARVRVVVSVFSVRMWRGVVGDGCGGLRGRGGGGGGSRTAATGMD